MIGALRVVVIAAAVAVPAAPAAAQRPGAPVVRWPQLELRADGFFADVDAVHLGIGMNQALGNYVRLGVIAAGGVAWTESEEQVGSARADLVARFVLDPFRQQRVGFAAGGGLSLRYDDDRLRPRLLLILGLEGRPRGGLLPAVEVGLGGGARVGVVLRRAVSNRR